MSNFAISTITASANTAMTNIIPLTYNLTADADVVEVKGTVRGAPLASSKIFAGIENPDGINSVGSSSSSTTFSPTSWTPESWGTPSSVPSNIISLGFSSSQIQSAEGKVSISASGNVSFTFNYATGNHRLNTTGVDILDSNGNVVAKDYHIGYSGTAYSNKTYTLNVPSAGTYTLRYFVETRTEKQKNNTGIEVLPKKGTKELLSRAGLLRAIIIMSAIGVLLIGSVWMNAKATDIKYSINKVNKECMTFEDEIDLLKVKIETANGIEAVEAYAIKEMGMKYPRTDQCIYIAEDAVVKDNLAEIIRQKAYK